MTTTLAGLSLVAAVVLPLVAANPAAAVVPTPPSPSCSISRFPGLPLVATDFRQEGFDPYSSLTATDNHGLWAGVRFDGRGVFRVITWRHGVTTVLDTFNYGNAWDSYTVRVIGITAARAIIVDVENRNIRNPAYRLTYRYEYGRRFSFAHNGSWTAWPATAVSPDGHVVGLASTPKGRLVVEWDRNGAVTTLSSGQVFQPLIDQYDDVIWTAQSPFSPSRPIVSAIKFRTPSGRLGRFLGTSYPMTAQAAGRWVWASDSDDENRILVETWDMAAAAHSDTLAPTSRRIQPSQLVAASSSGVYLALRNPPTTYGSSVLYDAYGDGHAMPDSLNGSAVEMPFYAVVGLGGLSITARNDHAYLVNCPLNYAKHNPRGLIYHGAVSSGLTIITGGAFDADSVASHVSVDIYDETTTVRHRLTRITADQYDPSFSSAYAITGNHRYRVAFPSATGRHIYCAYAMNIGYGNTNTRLGCTTVTT